MKPYSYYENLHGEIPDITYVSKYRVFDTKEELDRYISGEYNAEDQGFRQMSTGELVEIRNAGKFINFRMMALDPKQAEIKDRAHKQIRDSMYNDLFTDIGIQNSPVISELFELAQHIWVGSEITKAIPSYELKFDYFKECLVNVMNEQGGIDFINNPPDVESLKLQLQMLAKLS